jgi:hypothetical protein
VIAKEHSAPKAATVRIGIGISAENLNSENKEYLNI